MTTDLLEMVRGYSDRIQNGRSLEDIHVHLHDEVSELGMEMHGYQSGEDGIAGESIDVILCALDLIFKAAPHMTNEDIVTYARKKCDKWARKYS